MSGRAAVLVLERLLRHHYEAARSLSDVPWDRAVAHPLPGRPSIAWCVGHLIWCLSTVPALLDAPGAGPLPAEEPLHLDPDFGARDEAAWRELRARFAAGVEEALAAVSTLDDASLALPPGRRIHPALRDRLRTREAFLLGHAYHVAYHCGQMGLLRAALGLGS